MRALDSTPWQWLKQTSTLPLHILNDLRVQYYLYALLLAHELPCPHCEKVVETIFRENTSFQLFAFLVSKAIKNPFKKLIRT